jgi:calcium-dependent protein kinase
MLGSGSFGKVYIGHHKKVGIKRAIKSIKKEEKLDHSNYE